MRNPATTVIESAAVSGFLHPPRGERRAGLVLAHGAGSDCRAPLLAAVAEALAGTGVEVLRCNLPFRRKRPHGPPFPAEAAADRAGLRAAMAMLAPPVYVGGHSYGGRQASMLAADAPEAAAGLLLLSYPLHPPKRALEMRTAHFPGLRTPALFVHGTRDPFGSVEELTAALKMIPARIRLLTLEGAGHALKPAAAAGIAKEFAAFFQTGTPSDQSV